MILSEDELNDELKNWLLPQRFIRMSEVGNLEENVAEQRTTNLGAQYLQLELKIQPTNSRLDPLNHRWEALLLKQAARLWEATPPEDGRPPPSKDFAALAEILPLSDNARSLCCAMTAMVSPVIGNKPGWKERFRNGERLFAPLSPGPAKSLFVFLIVTIVVTVLVVGLVTAVFYAIRGSPLAFRNYLNSLSGNKQRDMVEKLSVRYFNHSNFSAPSKASNFKRVLVTY